MYIWLFIFYLINIYIVEHFLGFLQGDTQTKKTIIYNEVRCSNYKNNYKYNYINTYSLEFYSGSTVIHIK